MRPDMYQVIIERPRLGGSRAKGDGRARMRDRLDPEHAPNRGSMSRSHGTKHLNENLAPLRRFLRSRIGRPWDEVYSEICAHINLSSAVQKHVLDHLRDMVYTHVVRRGDELVMFGRYGLEPLEARRWLACVYVCPDTGVLRPLKRRPRPRPAPDPDVIRQGADAQLRRIDGVWYRLTLAPVPNDTSFATAVDVSLGRRLAELGPSWTLSTLLRERYGHYNRYAVAKRQLGKKELRRLPKELRA